MKSSRRNSNLQFLCAKSLYGFHMPVDNSCSCLSAVCSCSFLLHLLFIIHYNTCYNISYCSVVVPGNFLAYLPCAQQCPTFLRFAGRDVSSYRVAPVSVFRTDVVLKDVFVSGSTFLPSFTWSFVPLLSFWSIACVASFDIVSIWIPIAERSDFPLSK